MSSDRRSWIFWCSLGIVLLLSRLAHRNILWADEDYHLAAAIQMLHGKMPYRDFWYDKPPLAGLAALLFGGWYGWPLRLAGAGVALLSCWLAFRLADDFWGRREGYWAATLLGFFQIFYLPVAVIPFEPDTLMIAPHLGAVYLARRGRFAWAGVVAAAAYLLNPKGAMVLIVAGLFAVGGRVPRPAPRALPRPLEVAPTSQPGRWLRVEGPALLSMAAGFALPCVATTLWLGAAGALGDYVEQVWRWGALYIASPPFDPQAQKGSLALAGWMGFHAALVLPSLWFIWRAADRNRWKLETWMALALITSAIGGRFAPRYFDVFLTALVIPAARGIAMLENRRIAVALLGIALAVPAARFGPRYLQLERESWKGVPHEWTDVVMDQESRTAAAWLKANSSRSDSLFVWGYRPNVVVYSRLPVASRLWDSQAVTGVPADRHLTDSRPIAPEWAARNRAELAESHPTFIVDGLSAYNAALDIHRFPDLQAWLTGYCLGAAEGRIRIYRRCVDK